MAQVRPGTFALSLLSVPLNVHLLEALTEEPKSLSDLRRAAGAPSPTTMRKQLTALVDLEVLIRRQDPGFPGSVRFELGPAGGELLEITRLLQHWLAGSPEGPIAIGGSVAKNALKALVEGWNTKIIRALAARPVSLTDLNRLITAFNYPYLERRFSALRICGLIEARPGEGRGTLYGPSRWLQRACGPLMASAHWERRHAAPEVGSERFDFEAAFLLGTLGATLPSAANGRCRLGVEFRNGSGESALAGVQLQVIEGEVLSCVARPEGRADASASGPSSTWVKALMSGRPDELYLSGDRNLATEIVESLHRELFRARVQQPA
jgi:DNA-binding HxlR family transcriptional regulator